MRELLRCKRHPFYVLVGHQKLYVSYMLAITECSVTLVDGGCAKQVASP